MRLPAFLDPIREQIPVATRARVFQHWRRITRPAFFGTLRRTTPLNVHWGYDRGTPVDRYYIDRFLARHRCDIHGHVLEVKDAGYTARFGQGVTQSDVLDVDPANTAATIVADLAAADSIPADSFDCLVLTQVLQYVYDLPAALGHIRRILRPGGVVLVTVPGLGHLSPPGPLYWLFTPASCARLFADVFGAEAVTVRPQGNVLAVTAFLHGLAWEELSRRELNAVDDRFPLTITVRAVKRAPGAAPGPA